ncbi:MAG: response regulator transcription factor [Gaiellaceae bacterium]
MTALLLAESEPAVRGFLERQLRNDGFDVLAYERVEQLPRALDPDVLLLGDADALDRGLVPDCPVIVLGGTDPASRVRALARADDCLARPFVYEELLARIHALLRRCPPRVEQIDVGALSIDRAARRVMANGEEVELSAKEFALLVKLASDPDRVFTREQLLRDVWGFRTYVPTRTLESHASRIRRKLAAAGLPGWVVNVWGVGYKLRLPPLAGTADTSG